MDHSLSTLVLSRAVKMASEIAKVVLGSKLNEVTKGIQDAVGLDDKKETSTAEAEYAVKKEMEREKQRREEERKELHEYKEAERQNIRDKYKLNKKTKTTASRSSPKRSPVKTASKTKEESKCSIC